MGLVENTRLDAKCGLGLGPDVPSASVGHLCVQQPDLIVAASAGPPLDHISTLPWARLDGLKTEKLNGRARTVLQYNEDRHRCGFLVHGEREALPGGLPVGVVRAG